VELVAIELLICAQALFAQTNSLMPDSGQRRLLAESKRQGSQ
jgi:hypothetical protein